MLGSAKPDVLEFGKYLENLSTHRPFPSFAWPEGNQRGGKKQNDKDMLDTDKTDGSEIGSGIFSDLRGGSMRARF